MATVKKPKFNGWANRDTWLVNVWIDNDKRNYLYVKANKTRLLALKKASLFATLKRNLRFGTDKINWASVNSTEVKRSIRDVY